MTEYDKMLFEILKFEYLFEFHSLFNSNNLWLIVTNTFET